MHTLRNAARAAPELAHVTNLAEAALNVLGVAEQGTVQPDEVPAFIPANTDTETNGAYIPQATVAHAESSRTELITAAAEAATNAPVDAFAASSIRTRGNGIDVLGAMRDHSRMAQLYEPVGLLVPAYSIPSAIAAEYTVSPTSQEAFGHVIPAELHHVRAPIGADNPNVRATNAGSASFEAPTRTQTAPAGHRVRRGRPPAVPQQSRRRISNSIENEPETARLQPEEKFDPSQIRRGRVLPGRRPRGGAETSPPPAPNVTGPPVAGPSRPLRAGKVPVKRIPTESADVAPLVEVGNARRTRRGGQTPAPAVLMNEVPVAGSSRPRRDRGARNADEDEDEDDEYKPTSTSRYQSRKASGNKTNAVQKRARILRVEDENEEGPPVAPGRPKRKSEDDDDDNVEDDSDKPKRKRTKVIDDSDEDEWKPSPSPLSTRTAGRRVRKLLGEGQHDQNRSKARSRNAKSIHKCSKCEKTFTVEKDRNRHFESVHLKATWPCPCCKVSQCRRDALKRHVMSRNAAACREKVIKLCGVASINQVDYDFFKVKGSTDSETPGEPGGGTAEPGHNDPGDTNEFKDAA
ncbi:hypothetical protein WOLCODRAFT_166486 [Wolfiporia cocos MD-104 SS10]|uniref:C2H2-type domain-containing protein n=1 Tax=Wolfiporia cocos (strain MD-104) TaxID=742152 RepID=A0A2H3J0K3_WOLCO|nr:hypothetical protein WOLCODRAFT_166486 [Wolfiporia cocos MD-104 SS10]